MGYLHEQTSNDVVPAPSEQLSDSDLFDLQQMLELGVGWTVNVYLFDLMIEKMDANVIT